MEDLLNVLVEEISKKLSTVINTKPEISVEVLDEINKLIDLIKDMVYKNNSYTINTDDNESIQKLYLRLFKGTFNLLCDIYDNYRLEFRPDISYINSAASTKRRCTSCGMFVNTIRLYFLYKMGLTVENIKFLYMYNNDILSQECCIISVADQIFQKLPYAGSIDINRSNIMRSIEDNSYLQGTFVKNLMDMPQLINYTEQKIYEYEISISAKTISDETINILLSMTRASGYEDMLYNFDALLFAARELEVKDQLREIATVIFDTDTALKQYGMTVHEIIDRIRSENISQDNNPFFGFYRKLVLLLQSTELTI